MKISVVLLIVVSVLFVSVRSEEQINQPEDDTDSMLQLSKIIISTIQKYDHTQKGIIPFDKYHLFLHEIFIQGHQLNKNTQQDSQIPQDISDLLKLATQQFKKFRYEDSVAKESEDQQEKLSKKTEKRQFVELQQFYMDLIKHFSQFLDLDHNIQKYQSVNDFFFTEDSTQNSSSSIKQNQQKNPTQDDKMQL